MANSVSRGPFFVGAYYRNFTLFDFVISSFMG